MNAIRYRRDPWITADRTRALVAIGFVAGVVIGLIAPATAAEPLIRAVPASIGLGQEWTIVGSGFCGQPGCSVVSITADGQQLVPPVTVRPDGTFRVTAVAGPAVGFVRIVATQRSKNGTTVQASTSLTINPPPPVTPGTTRPPTSTTEQSSRSTTTPTSTAKEPPSATTTPTSAVLEAPNRTTTSNGPARDEGQGAGRVWLVLAVALGLGATGWLARRTLRHKS